MNVTELARILKVTPQELRDKLPQMGFHIGQKAIKVDSSIANKIVKAWPAFIRQLQFQDQLNQKNSLAEKEDLPKKEVRISKMITVRDLADLAEIPVNKILAELMRNSIFTSINEKIDFDTAAVIGADLGLDIKLNDDVEVEVDNSQKLRDIINKEEAVDLVDRAPVIVVMGHVDHGKTRLLDTIRQTNVIATEAGGITQHIGAYQINYKEREMTFIDTPGHEAFTAMRNRGAKVADIAILVVAADDGVMQQTVEAYRIIEAAKIPFVVAINKIDKPEANLDKTKQELSSKLGIIPEDWGGKIVCVPISAKDNIGISDLLDMILLAADVESENLKANPLSAGVGTIIESKIDKGEGVIATVLVQNGTLRIGDNLCFDGMMYGRVRSLKNHLGQNILEAGPSVPAKIIGLKVLTQVGDIMEVGTGERIKVSKMRGSQTEAPKISLQNNNEDDDTSTAINLIIKADTFGSAEAIEGSLSKIDTQGVRIRILSKGLGNVTEGDIDRAQTSGALVIGFSVKIPPQVEEMARTKKIEVKSYRIIYELINEIKVKIQELVKPEIERVELGDFKVMALFRTEAKSQIVGGKVMTGCLEPNVLVEVIRDHRIIEFGKLTHLKSGKEDVTVVDSSQECGLRYEGNPIIEVGDYLKVYKEKKIFKKIK